MEEKREKGRRHKKRWGKNKTPPLTSLKTSVTTALTVGGLLLAIILPLTAPTLFVQDTRGAPPTPYIVYGHVYDGYGTPVPGATVYINDTTGTTESLTTTTNDTGYYTVTLSNIADGDTITGAATKDGKSGQNNTTADTSQPDKEFNITISTLDITPPQPATWKNITREGENLTLEWTPSPSPDVAQYDIYISTDPNNFDFANPNATLPATATNWTHTGAFSTSNNLFYLIRATDTSGNTENNTNIIGKTTPTIRRGWNLITNPTTTPMRAGDIAADMAKNGIHVTVICRWLGTRWQTWISAMPDRDNFTIDPAEGYFVWSSTDGLWTPQHPLIDQPQNITFHAGWNLIAIPHHNKTIDNATAVINSINQQNGPKTVTWLVNWTKTGWSGCHIGVGDNFALDDKHHPWWANARGYAMFATKEGVWTPPG